MYRLPSSWHRIALLVVIPLCSATSVSCARPTHHSLTKPEQECYEAINSAHAQEETAVSQKDIDGVMASCSLDYVTTKPDGQTVNYAQVRQSMVTLFQTTSSMKETNTIEDIHLVGNTVTVMVRNHVEATFPISNPFTGKPMTRTQDHLDRETWVKVPQGWRLTKTDVLQSGS